MPPIRIPVALSSIVLVTACATATDPFGERSAAAKADEHASHHPVGATSTPSGAPMHERMKAMREMHYKMMTAKSPEERQALMADHMQAMQGGMQMMKGMGTKAPVDMATRQKMMEDRMETMQMMMEMMMQRVPASAAVN